MRMWDGDGGTDGEEEGRDLGHDFGVAHSVGRRYVLSQICADCRTSVQRSTAVVKILTE